MSFLDNPAFLTFAEFQLPFLAYFGGITIRKIALDRPGSPRLRYQFLLGIPLSLIGISPVLYMFEAALNKTDRVESISAYLLTLGLVMIKGMILPEMVTRHLLQWIKSNALGASPIIDESSPAVGHVTPVLDDACALPDTVTMNGNTTNHPHGQPVRITKRHRLPHRETPGGIASEAEPAPVMELNHRGRSP